MIELTKRLFQEVPIHTTGGYAQVVSGLQSIIAIIVVCWVFKG